MNEYLTNRSMNALYNQAGSLRPSEKSDISLNILKLPPSITENLIKSDIITVNDLLNQNQFDLLRVPYISYASIDRIISSLHDYNQGVIKENYTPEIEPSDLDDPVILLNIDKRIMRGLNNHYNTTQSWHNLRNQHNYDFYYHHILNNDGSIPTPLEISIRDILGFSQDELLTMRYVGEVVVYDLVNKLVGWCNRHNIDTEKFRLFNYKRLYSQDRNIIELTPVSQKPHYYNFTLYQADEVVDHKQNIRINNQNELLQILKEQHSIISKIFLVSHPTTDPLFKDIPKVNKIIKEYDFEPVGKIISDYHLSSIDSIIFYTKDLTEVSISGNNITTLRINGQESFDGQHTTIFANDLSIHIDVIDETSKELVKKLQSNESILAADRFEIKYLNDTYLMFILDIESKINTLSSDGSNLTINMSNNE